MVPCGDSVDAPTRGVRAIISSRLKSHQDMPDLYAGFDPSLLPAYTAADAGRFLKVPPSTVRSWVKGQYYTANQGKRFFKPLIELPESDSTLLSFTNLVELHVLAAIRRTHQVPLGRVRDALDYVDHEMATAHPLARIEFQTNGIELFVEYAGKLLAISRNGQLAIREALEIHLRRIVRDEEGLAARLFPFTRVDGPDQPSLVVIDPRISFGRPILTGTGIRTEVIAERYLSGESVVELADDYGCETIAVEEAIRCEMRLAA